MNIKDGKKHLMLLLGFVNLNKYDSNMQDCKCWYGLPCKAYFCNPQKWGRVSDELLQEERREWFLRLAEDRQIREMETFYPLDNPDLMREWQESA